MHTELRNRATEGALLAVFLAWLIWLPMPFGSVTDSARLPLIAVPLALCLLAALLRMWGGFSDPPGRIGELAPQAWRIWTIGSLLFLAAIVLQLVPLPPPLLRVLSPQSANIWAGGDRVAALLRAPVARMHPISIDPGTTAREWFRMLALFATFMTSSLLVRTHWRRIAFAVALIGAATFEFLYGVNEAALRRYAIWGWKNTFMFGRVSGTYVNPNHFAHYLAIVLPMALFIVAWAWHHAAPGTPFGRRVARLLEKNVLAFGIGALGATGCLAGILVGQSRGALLAVFSALFIIALFAIGGTLASVVVLGSLVIFLGRDRTIERFTPNEGETITLVGRTVGAKIAFGTWKEFPIFGSGAGTFVDVSSTAQSDSLQSLFDHAHDDYLEIAATTGALGFTIAIVTLLAGYWSLVRITFGESAVGSFRRCAFQGAALTSVTVAMVHALFDFNFFIPANPATLAAIAGAAVAAYSRSFDADATADRVARHRVRKAHVDPVDSA
jgi:O-antigen ligase